MAETAQGTGKLLVEYLLGQLPEERQVEVEDRAFTDPAYLTDIQAAEAELIDAYVRGELPGPDRRDFERMFLASPQRRSKVAFAHAFARVADEYSPPATKRSSGFQAGFQALLDMIRGWNPAVQFAAGMAALICVAGVSWLAVRDRAIETQVALLEQRGAALAQEADSLRQQLAQERGRRAAETQLPVASLTLLPGVARGENRTVRFTIGNTARLARIELQMADRDNFPRYRAELRTAAGEDVLSLNNLEPRRVTDGLAVMLEVAASVLPAGRYELALKGLPRNEPSRDIGFYYFTVERR